VVHVPIGLTGQVLRRASVNVIAPFLDPHQDVIMSVEGTRLRLLALNCLVPGASTLLANLLRTSGAAAGLPSDSGRSSGTRRTGSVPSSPRSSRDDSLLSQQPSREVGSGDQKLPPARRSLFGSLGSLGRSRDDSAGGRGRKVQSMADRQWLREYADGAHSELFFCPAGPALAGLRFANAAEAVYEATGGVLVGAVQVGGTRGESWTSGFKGIWGVGAGG
jgi:hypothetical protein